MVIVAKPASPESSAPTVLMSATSTVSTCPFTAFAFLSAPILMKSPTAIPEEAFSAFEISNVYAKLHKVMAYIPNSEILQHL